MKKNILLAAALTVVAFTSCERGGVVAEMKPQFDKAMSRSNQELTQAERQELEARQLMETAMFFSQVTFVGADAQSYSTQGGCPTMGAQVQTDELGRQYVDLLLASLPDSVGTIPSLPVEETLIGAVEVTDSLLSVTDEAIPVSYTLPAGNYEYDASLGEHGGYRLYLTPSKETY